MRWFLRLSIVLFGLSRFASPASAQPGYTFKPPKEIDLSGPRIGLTVLGPGSIDRLKTEDIHVNSVVSQFGWQFEKRFYTSQEGLTMLTEFVPLLSGLEQGVALPSLNWLVGVRGPSGLEFGIGPNVSPAGAALVLAGGVTFRAGAMNIPLNVAFVPSRSGSRVSILSGFSLRR